MCLRFFTVCLQVASLGELAQALHVGFAASHIVFDSPAKTVQEIEYALRKGVRMNFDNFQELDRAASIIKSQPELVSATPDLLLGLRINPQVSTFACMLQCFKVLNTNCT